jgi:hypothetical protein
VRSVTAAGRNSLKALPLGKLKNYVASYGIRIDRAVEKDDIIDAILAAKVGYLIRIDQGMFNVHSLLETQWMFASC